MNSIDCNIIKDLLPTYIDGLTSKESNQLIEEHLAGCEQCRQLTETLKVDVQFSGENTNPEIDYLKKVRAKRKKLLLTTISLCVLVFLALISIGIKIFVMGSPVSFDEIGAPSEDEYGGIRAKFNPETNELTIYGELMDERLEVTRVKIELDKTLADAYDVTVYGAPRLFAGGGQNDSFEEVIKIPDDNEKWSVYSMGPTPHDVVMFWWNADIIEEKIAQPKAKLTEYLTAHKQFLPENNQLDYSYFAEVLGEPSYIFYFVKYVDGIEEISSLSDVAVSENGEHFYQYNRDIDKWELLNK